MNLQNPNKGIGFIGTFKFAKLNDDKVKEIFESKLTKFIKGFNEQTFHTIDYNNIDEDGEFTVINYSEINNIEAEKNFHKYHLVFKIIPPFTPTPNILNRFQVQIKANFNISQYEVLRKLFNAIKDKHAQHANSSYNHKIYFIDSETLPDFDFSIFRTNAMFEENKIIEFVNTFSENEIFCFIRREYMDIIPKISIKVFGNNIDKDVKQRLENLRTNFDYHIQVSHRRPFQFIIKYNP